MICLVCSLPTYQRDIHLLLLYLLSTDTANVLLSISINPEPLRRDGISGQSEAHRAARIKFRRGHEVVRAPISAQEDAINTQQESQNVLSVLP